MELEDDPVSLVRDHTTMTVSGNPLASLVEQVEGVAVEVDVEVVLGVELQGLD